MSNDVADVLDKENVTWSFTGVAGCAWQMQYVVWSDSRNLTAEKLLDFHSGSQNHSSGHGDCSTTYGIFFKHFAPKNTSSLPYR